MVELGEQVCWKVPGLTQQKFEERSGRILMSILALLSWFVFVLHSPLIPTSSPPQEVRRVLASWNMAQRREEFRQESHRRRGRRGHFQGRTK